MKIKTATEILDELYMKNPSNRDYHIDAMKIYAKQFIDLAAERATFIVKDPNDKSEWNTDSYNYGDNDITINTQSILDIKKEIK